DPDKGRRPRGPRPTVASAATPTVACPAPRPVPAPTRGWPGSLGCLSPPPSALSLRVSEEECPSVPVAGYRYPADLCRQAAKMWTVPPGYPWPTVTGSTGTTTDAT